MSLPNPKRPANLTFSSPVPRRGLRVGLITLGVALLAGTAFVFTRKPVPPPEVLVYTPRQAQTAQAHVDAVRKALERDNAPAPTAAKQGSTPAADTQIIQHIPQKHGPDLVKLQLSQADLNAYFATDPKVKAMLASHHVRAVQMLLKEPRGITVRAAITRGGHPYNVQIEMTVRADPKSGLQVTATGAQVGRLPLPPAMVTAQANKVAGQVTGRMKGRLPVILQDVRVQGDTLVLLGTAHAAKPK